MGYLQTAILAVIQGAAELLPISSSAHVIFAEHLMGIDPADPKATFLLVMLHTGTMGAVLVYFWPRWKRLLVPQKETASVDNALSASRFLVLVLIATAVTGVLGFCLKIVIENVIMERVLHYEKAEVELLFRKLPLIAGSLFAVGFVILAAGFVESRATSPTLTTRDSAIIGLVQGLCLPFRGFSRSGATISTALFRGVNRSLAEDFSFALAVALTPPVIARELYRLLKSNELSAGKLVPLLAPALTGMVLSFLAGLLALRLLSAALERGRWRYFGVYCLAAAVLLMAYALVTKSHST